MLTLVVFLAFLFVIDLKLELLHWGLTQGLGPLGILGLWHFKVLRLLIVIQGLLRGLRAVVLASHFTLNVLLVAYIVGLLLVLSESSLSKLLSQVLKRVAFFKFFIRIQRLLGAAELDAVELCMQRCLVAHLLVNLHLGWAVLKQEGALVQVVVQGLKGTLWRTDGAYCVILAW